MAEECNVLESCLSAVFLLVRHGALHPGTSPAAEHAQTVRAPSFFCLFAVIAARD